MKPLLAIPEHIIKENTVLVRDSIDLFKQHDWENLNRQPVMIDQDGKAISFFGDNEWDLSQYVDTKIVTKKKVTFTHLAESELLQEQKMLAFLMLYSVGSLRKGVVIKTSTFISRNTVLTQIYKILYGLGGTSICFLNHPIQFSRFCEKLQKLGHTMGTNYRYLGILRWVEHIRDESPIKLNIPNFKHPKILARKLTAPDKLEQGQHYAIPSRLMQLIYAKAIDYIEKYHPIHNLLLNIHTELQENYEIGKSIVDKKMKSGQWKWLTQDSQHYRVEISKSLPQKPTQIIKSYIANSSTKNLIPSTNNQFTWLYSHLITCCILLCGAFSGMRRSEIYSLHPESFKILKLKGQTFYSMEGMHSKLAPALPEKAEWLTSPVAGKAIDLASKLTQNMRIQLMMSDQRSDNEIATSIWLIQRAKSKKPRIFAGQSLASHYAALVEESGALINEDDLTEFQLLNPNQNTTSFKERIAVGQPWPLSTHQLRRTFAVFGKRHNLLSDVAIKQQFKHLYLMMSQWYGEGGVAARIKNIKVDFELNSLLSEIDKEVTTQQLFNWYNTDEKLYGKKGHEIMEDRKFQGVKYTSWEALHSQVSAGRISIAGTLHSYCMAGYQCRMEKVVSPTNCFTCENVVIDEAKAKSWQNRHQWIIETIVELEKRAKLSHSQISHFITQLRAAEKVMDYFEISYTPYRPEIEITQI